MVQERGIDSTDFGFVMFTNGTDADMTVDGGSSDGPVDYTVGPFPNYKAELYRVNIAISDGGMGYGGAEFAGLGSALTNGIEILLLDSDDSTKLDFTDGYNIKVNEDWNMLSGVDGVATAAAGDDFMPIRWTLAKATGAPLALGYNEYMRIRIQDSCTDISYFRAMAQFVYTEHIA